MLTLVQLLISIATLNLSYCLRCVQLVPKRLPLRLSINDVSSYQLALKPWEDDLPNLFGINPIEATLIFGALYYVYGPTTLYEYAREAGKFFTTYGPVVKDIAGDIFNEFRDYLEEDRERETLRKSGIDISLIPRRTTNLIERIQEGLETISEATALNTGSSELQKGYQDNKDNKDDTGDRGDDVASTVSSSPKKRRKKKEVLIERNVDIDKVIEQSKKAEQPVDVDLSKSIAEVQARVAALAAGGSPRLRPPSISSPPLPNPSRGIYDDLESSYDDDNTNWDGLDDMMTRDYKALAADRAALRDNQFDQSVSATEFGLNQEVMSPAVMPSAASVDEGTGGMTKFQLQMSGQWNQQVLMRESGDKDMSNGLDMNDNVNELPSGQSFNDEATPASSSVVSSSLFSDTSPMASQAVSEKAAIIDSGMDVGGSNADEGTVGMTKFQLQMSGQWNQQVLMRESGDASIGGPSTEQITGDVPASIEDAVGGAEVGVGVFTEEWRLAQVAGLRGPTDGRESRQGTVDPAASGDVPWELEAPGSPRRMLDSPPDIDTVTDVGFAAGEIALPLDSDVAFGPVAPAAAVAGGIMQIVSDSDGTLGHADAGLSVSGNSSQVDAAAVAALLHEIDSDYSRLRSKLVALLEQSSSPPFQKKEPLNQ